MSGRVSIYLNRKFSFQMPSAKLVNIGTLKRFANNTALLMGFNSWIFEIRSLDGKRLEDAISRTNYFNNHYLDGGAMLLIDEV